MRFVGKIIVLTFNDKEEKAVERVLAIIADMIPLEAIQPPQSPALVFPGLEIRQHQRRVLKDGADIYLTRLEYSALCYLASNPGIVLTQTQIFEAVWNMDSGSCYSNVANVIYNLRKKIEPDNKLVFVFHFRFSIRVWETSQQIKILYVTSHKDREFFGIEYSIPMLAIPLF